MAIVGQEPIPGRVRWTRAQCRAIQEQNILRGRYELIDGELISKMGQNPPHKIAVILLQIWLASVFGALHVQTQATIDVGPDADPDHNEPEPDAAVIIEPITMYTRHPGPDDLLLVVEVSDTTLRFDRSMKAALYARAGIREYWIVDVVGRQILVHRQPGTDGYAEVRAFGTEDQIATLACPGERVRIGDLLPPTA